MRSRFTPSHRGGSGPPMVLLHGFADTWRTWELVLPALERRHDVLALTLPGHAGGPPIEGEPTEDAMLDAVERAMDEAGFPTAHLVGNSLGGYLALQLAARGRADTVVAFSPAGGWARGDDSFKETLAFQAELLETANAGAAHAETIVASAHGRRQATASIVENFEHLPPELIAHQMRAVAGCDGGAALIERALAVGWAVDAEHVTCPVRIVWGTADRLTPWPRAAARYLHDWLPHADWVELEDVGHCPQLDVPVESSQLILGFAGLTAAGSPESR